MSDNEKFNAALDLFIESLYKPDHELRNDARGEEALDDLLNIRDLCVVFCKELRKSSL
tara:strand:+ start:330 stop:503 length:174 start_codon:yes stop_codon:yes gene_type:complete